MSGVGSANYKMISNKTCVPLYTLANFAVLRCKLVSEVNYQFSYAVDSLHYFTIVEMCVLWIKKLIEYLTDDHFIPIVWMFTDVVYKHDLLSIGLNQFC